MICNFVVNGPFPLIAEHPTYCVGNRETKSVKGAI